MKIAIDLPAHFPPGWKMTGGALEYANSAGDIDILLPHAPVPCSGHTDPQSWDGAIVQFPRPDLKVPQVCVSPGLADDVVSVAIDQDEVVRLAVDQFAALGLGSFALFGPNWEIAELRWKCFSRQVEGLGFAPVWLSSERLPEEVGRIRKPCGIMAVNDYQAAILLRTCERMGLRVPGDVHIISVDNLPLCLESTPTLSSISMPFAMIGFHAAKLCAQMINGEPVDSIKLSPSGLIIRDSIKIESDDIKTATEIAHYLRTNLSYPIQMGDIVRRSALSRRTLEEVFRNTYGSSPIAYLRELRLERTKELLGSSNKRLKNIVSECGYRDSNHLCRNFKERVGMSPLAYRKMNRAPTD